MNSQQSLLIASTLPHHEITAAPDLLNPRRTRRLIDYTKRRSDGTKSTRAQKSRENEQPKRVRTLGMPTCVALEASLVTALLSKEATEVTSQQDEEEQQEEERIDFFFKVSPTGIRKTTRVSSLDRAVDRIGGTLEKTKSSRSLQRYRSKSPPARRSGLLVRRSMSTPCS